LALFYPAGFLDGTELLTLGLQALTVASIAYRVGDGGSLAVSMRSTRGCINPESDGLLG